MALTVTKTCRGIVTEALEKLQVVDSEEAISANDFSKAARALNLLLLSLQMETQTIWKRARVEITCVDGTAEYTPAFSDTTTAGMELVQAMCGDTAGDNEMPLTIISRLDYMEQPDKESEGRPTMIWFHVTNAAGKVTLWPVPDAAYVVKLDLKKPFTELDGESDAIDCPSYWMEAIVWALAARLLPDFGLTGTNDASYIVAQAKDLMDTAAAYEVIQDGGEVRMVPDLQDYYR